MCHDDALYKFTFYLLTYLLFLQCFLLSLSFLDFVWLRLCTAPLKWLCVIYGTLYKFSILHYITLHWDRAYPHGVTYAGSMLPVEGGW